MTLVLAACGGPSAGPLEISVIAGAGRGVTDEAAYGLTAATRAGLVQFDADGHVIPALAERWIITDDALAYIFRLRDAQWNDGTPVTAADVAAGLRRTLAAAHGNGLGHDLAAVRAVKVMATRVLEIDLDQPQPDLLTLLAQPDLAITGGGRTPRYAGQMQAHRDGDHWIAALVAPDRPGLPLIPQPVRSQPLAIRTQSADDAVARFARGSADVVLGGTFDSLPLAMRVALARGNLQFDPVAGLFGIDVLSAKGFLASASNREAIAMAIDREGLVAALGLSAGQATTRIVTAGLDGDNDAVSERWIDQTLAQRRAVASARVLQAITAAAKAPGAAPGQAATAPVLTLALPGGPGSALVFDHLHADLAAIGVTLVRAEAGQGADLTLVDSIARYSRARWFLGRLSCASHPVACAPLADADLDMAVRSTDPDVAAQLYAEAEGKVTAANGFIPLARPVRWSLVRSNVTGFAPNPWGWHALPPLAGADTGHAGF